MPVVTFPRRGSDACGYLPTTRQWCPRLPSYDEALLDVVAVGAACFDTVRQHPRLSERLHRALTPHRHQLLHRVAGGRRYHGGRARHATGRLRRGTSTLIRTR